jgi:hypothetical protein
MTGRTQLKEIIMGSRSIPKYKGSDPEGLARAEFVKERLTDPERWGALKDYAVTGLIAPLSKANQVGQHMKDVYAGRAAPNPILAAEAALTAQGAGHATGAGGTGVASIGKSLAIKKVQQQGIKQKVNPQKIEQLTKQIQFAPQEQLDDVTDIVLKDLSKASPSGKTRGGYSSKTGRVYVDPKTAAPTTLHHEMTHGTHTTGGGLTPKNRFYSDIMNSIQERVTQKTAKGGKRTKDYYKLYMGKQIPTEHLAQKTAEAMSTEMYKRKGLSALSSSLTNQEYNKMFEKVAEPIISGLKKTAPKTYKKARSSALSKYIASGKET